MSKCPIIRDRCPESAKCPCWQQLTMENTATGETKVVSDCIHRLMPVLMVEVIKAANRPAAAVESIRNEMARGLGAIAGGVEKMGAARKGVITHDG